jgi:hypothetical protein
MPSGGLCVQLLCDEHFTTKRECTRCVNKATKMARTDLGMIFTDTHNRLMIRTQMITGLSQLLNVDGITLPSWGEQVQAHMATSTSNGPHGHTSWTTSPRTECMCTTNQLNRPMW